MSSPNANAANATARAKEFLQSPHGALVLLAVLANAALWILVITTFPTDTPATILHYTAGIGIDFIGEGRQIYVLPRSGTGLLIANIALALAIRRASTYGFWILWAVNPIIQLILVTAYAVIWSLN